MAYRLIALDLDGTLVSEDRRISRRAKQTIRRAMDEGIAVTLASGRSLPSLRGYIQELNVEAPIITCQGGKVVLPDTGRVLSRSTLPLSAAHAVIHYAQKSRLGLVVFVDDQVEDHVYVCRGRVAEDVLDRLSGPNCSQVQDLMAAVECDPTKLVIFAEWAENDNLFRDLQGRFGSVLQFVRSSGQTIEAIPLGVSKGRALQLVSTYLAIPRGQTVAIGDADNDVEMVAWAGLGVAMGNASEKVKAVADFIVPSVKEDGAAIAIEAFCLDG